MTAYLVYLSWTIRRGWKHSMASSRPYKYSSDQEHFQPKQGDSIWVVSCPRWEQDRLPPTLIARLEAARDCIDLLTANDASPEERAFRRYGRYLAVSDAAHGEYFPVNNLYNTLMALEFTTGKAISACPRCTQAEADPAKPFYNHIATHLQTIRRLSQLDVDRLERHAGAVRSQRVFFISYRHSEAAQEVRKFAANLSLGGGGYWLDSEMIRYRAAGESGRIPEEKLKQYLSDGIRQAYVFVAFVSQSYLERKWIRYELEKAREYGDQGHLKRVVVVYLDPAAGRLPIPAQHECYLPPPGERRDRELAALAGRLLE
jgi:hypothetical protein